MEKKQSSIDWLVEQIKKDVNLRLRGFDIDKKSEQAKAMHKEEIINVYKDILWYQGNVVETESEEYYNETFGK